MHGFVAVAEREGFDASALTAAGTRVASVGPVTAASLRDHGLPVHVEPRTPRMGAMYQEPAAALAAVARRRSGSSRSRRGAVGVLDDPSVGADR